MFLNSSRRIQDTPLGSGVKRVQYESTRKWAELLRRFSTEVPLRNHKKQLKNYPDTFTGKEAMELMELLLPAIFNKRDCNYVDAAKKVLNNFLESKYIVNVRDEQNKLFFDNATLYSLCNDKINEFLIDHMPSYANNVKRSAAVTRVSSVRENRNSRQQETNTVISRARLDLDTSAEWSRLNGRLSVSCQELASLTTKNKPKYNAKQPEIETRSTRANLSGFILGSVSKASSSIFSINRAASETRKRGNTNPKALDTAVLKDDSNRRMDQQARKASASRSFFNMVSNLTANAVENQAEKKSSISPNDPSVTTSSSFCVRINKSTYEQQSKAGDQHMLKLLDAILTDENLEPSEKFEKLKTFRISYPSIYASRFPSQTDDPLRKLASGNNGTALTHGNLLRRKIPF